jgi:hypothetical protein
MGDTAESIDEMLERIREAPTASHRDLGIDLKALERGLAGMPLQEALLGFSYLARQQSAEPKGIMAIPIRTAEAVDKEARWHGTWGFMGGLFIFTVLAFAWWYAGG